MAGATDIARWRVWVMAVRPQTLPAGIAPVVVGSAAALADDVFAPGPAVAALVGALLIQIGTNFANDYYDGMRGVDTDEREGFTRVTQAGLIPPSQVKLATIGTFLAAILVGCYLVYVGGLPIVIIGLLAVLCGIAYAGGPVPYGSYGLGDLFVFVFFGIIAVTGTYYVQAAAIVASPFPLSIPANTVTLDVLIISFAIAGIVTAILVVNNLRDIRTDADAGKRTLAVIVGERYTRMEFVLLLIIAYMVPFVLLSRGYGWYILLPLLSLPLAGYVLQMVLYESGPQLNRTLERTGQLLLLFALLLAIGVLLG